MNIGEGSGIPQPSMLRQPRASMAPSMFGQGIPGSVMKTARKAEAPGLLGAQTPANVGMSRMFGGANPPMSHARNPTAGGQFAAQTPATNRGNRRVSVFASARRTTLNVSMPGTISRGGSAIKDPRPIKDRNFMAKGQQRIMNYLSTHAYPGMLTPKTLSMPTAKDFQNIFKFLYGQLDPRYTYQKKFDDDVLNVLRGIHYPYVGNISKSHIHSAGSMTTWPGLLAMLLWLVELIECVTQMNPQNIDVNDPEFKDSAQFVDRVFFDYLSRAYPVWLDSGDEPTELEANLAKQFDQKNASLIQDIANVERQLANSKIELDALLSNESPLVQLERERVEQIVDKEKVEKYIHTLERKHGRMADHVAAQRQQHDAAQVEQMALERDKAEVQKIVDAQQISTEDVDRMNSEHNQLLETLNGVQSKLKEVVNEVWDREMKLQRVLDDVESLSQEYTSKAHKLGLIGARNNPMSTAAQHGKPGDDEDIVMSEDGVTQGLPESAKDDPLGGADIELIINTRTDDRQKITSVDLRRDVRPALQRACDVFASQLHATQTAVLRLRENIDQLSESRMEKEGRVEDMVKQVKRHNQMYTELRETIMAETRASTAQIEQLEADIVGMRRTISQGELQSKAAQAHAEAEWESVQRGCRLRRGEVNEDIVAVLEDTMQMMGHARARLDELQQFVSNDTAM
ncbi:kinetochore-associated Ndc80 complex subunit ndc80 [Coemansia sp. RSA 1813]|nr:kinetochore-associated Ndc80 complex subunit ndc80 [Coemansia sp. RSA 1646]KAJ1773601.1 kinetochore-associated Ndc80 complex subunit ndc80 [Coemansia sp. RSA 1843]KAJ2092383.1 kinetochore-associated Ndc80 complex subunit ndc80 [Coemansia sp. RSA 986]KAJ2572617.1 kinetochore-associated Ndc80 complex subunit ndc80 [Coemansia sp. RSA 1813]